jgi:hypothetical protein
MSAVIAVGDGRGFVVGNRREPYIITAAHCLPKFPCPCRKSNPNIVMM